MNHRSIIIALASLFVISCHDDQCPDVTVNIYVGDEDGDADADTDTDTDTDTGVDEALVLWLPFSEGTGNTTTDASGAGYEGLIEGATWSKGVYGSGLQYDGVDDYVDFGDILNDLAVPFSVCAWLLVDSTADLRLNVVGSDYHESTYYGFWMLVNSSTPTSTTATPWTAACQMGDGNGASSGNRRGMSSETPVPNDVWSHLCSVFIGETDITIYIDGVDASGSYGGSGGQMVHSSAPLYVGHSKVWESDFFKGTMDELRIYDRALDASEVASLATP
jgi:hypothetical protein